MVAPNGEEKIKQLLFRLIVSVVETVAKSWRLTWHIGAQKIDGLFGDSCGRADSICSMSFISG